MKVPVLAYHKIDFPSKDALVRGGFTPPKRFARQMKFLKQQGYEFYTALKQQGVPTRMIVLPRQPHGPTEPKMQIAAMQANLDWFEKYLK